MSLIGLHVKIIIIVTTKINKCEIPCSTIRPETDMNLLVFCITRSCSQRADWTSKWLFEFSSESLAGSLGVHRETVLIDSIGITNTCVKCTCSACALAESSDCSKFRGCRICVTVTPGSGCGCLILGLSVVSLCHPSSVWPECLPACPMVWWPCTRWWTTSLWTGRPTCVHTPSTRRCSASRIQTPDSGPTPSGPWF